MTVKKALIIEGVYLHAVDAPGLDDIQVYVSDDTVDITTHHQNTICLDFEELDAINALVAEARKPKRMDFPIGLTGVQSNLAVVSKEFAGSIKAGLDAAVRESERRAIEGARNPTPTWPPDWSKISIGFDHAAVDADGRGWAYQTKPTTIRFMWAGGWLNSVKDLGQITLPPGMTWQESYCTRPLPVDDLAFVGLNWADVPEQFIYVAADGDGKVYAYLYAPELLDVAWGHTHYQHITTIEPGSFGDWKKSLRIRPTAMKQVLGIDWASVPSQYNYVAADEDGRVFGYRQRPVRFSSVWYGAGSVTLTQVTLPPNLSWRNTLFVRPGYTEPQS